MGDGVVNNYAVVVNAGAEDHFEEARKAVDSLEAHGYKTYALSKRSLNQADYYEDWTQPNLEIFLKDLGSRTDDDDRILLYATDPDVGGEIYDRILLSTTDPDVEDVEYGELSLIPDLFQLDAALETDVIAELHEMVRLIGEEQPVDPELFIEYANAHFSELSDDELGNLLVQLAYGASRSDSVPENDFNPRDYLPLLVVIADHRPELFIVSFLEELISLGGEGEEIANEVITHLAGQRPELFKRDHLEGLLSEGSGDVVQELSRSRPDLFVTEDIDLLIRLSGEKNSIKKDQQTKYIASGKTLINLAIRAPELYRQPHVKPLIDMHVSPPNSHQASFTLMILSQTRPEIFLKEEVTYLCQHAGYRDIREALVYLLEKNPGVFESDHVDILLKKARKWKLLEDPPDKNIFIPLLKQRPDLFGPRQKAKLIRLIRRSDRINPEVKEIYESVLEESP